MHDDIVTCQVISLVLSKLAAQCTHFRVCGAIELRFLGCTMVLRWHMLEGLQQKLIGTRL